LPPQATVAENVNWPQIAARFELTGANIVNVVQHSLLTMLAGGKQVLDYQQIEAGVVRELVKEGKLI
jgi:hypothetical protein